MSADHSQAPQVALVPANEAAALLCIGVSTFWRYHSAGKVPEPVHLGGRTLWRIDEFKAWIDAGCPSKTDWNRHERNRWSSSRLRTVKQFKNI